MATMTKEEEEKAMNKSEYDKVIFHDVAESYSTDADVECRYSLTPSVKPQEGDLMAVFRVGCKDVVGFHTFQWINVDEAKEEEDRVILFKAQDLPKDDGHFYQFCYINAEKAMKGASTPFRFFRPSDEDLVAVEDNDNDLMIIRTRTAVIEEKLRGVTMKNSQLLKEKSNLENLIEEKENRCLDLDLQLKEREMKLGKQMEEMAKIKNALEAERFKGKELLQGLKNEKCNSEQKVVEMKKSMLQNEAYIGELRGTVKVLSEQKEGLSKKLTSEIKETNSLKVQVNESESRLKAFNLKCSQLVNELATQRDASAKLQHQTKSLEVNLKEEQKEKNELKSKLLTAEAEKKHVISQLLDTEHMLAAMEKSKQLATEELVSYSNYKTKMNGEVMRLSAENKTLLKKCKDLEKDYKEMVSKKENVEKELKAVMEDYESLKKDSEESLAREKRSDENEAKMKALVNDLSFRLKSGAREYQKKYIECLKLEKKMGKLKEMRERHKNKSHSVGKLEYTHNKDDNAEDGSLKQNKQEMMSALMKEKDILIDKLDDEIKTLKNRMKSSDLKHNIYSGRICQNTSQETETKNVNQKEEAPFESSAFAKRFPRFATNPFLESDSSRSSDSDIARFCDVNKWEQDGEDKCEKFKVLPPPIQPEMTMKARYAAIAAVNRRLSEGPNEFDDLPSQNQEETTGSECTNTSEEADKDVTCPMCGLVYHHPYDIRDLQNHINTHFDLECPMCSRMFEPHQQKQFQLHVQSHFVVPSGTSPFHVELD